MSNFKIAVFLAFCFAFRNVQSAPPTKNTADDLQTIIDSNRAELTRISNNELLKLLQAVSSLKQLAEDSNTMIDSTASDMISVASERIDSLKQQGEEAGVDVSKCFLDIDAKMSDAINPWTLNILECGSDQVSKSANELTIAQGTVQNALGQVEADGEALKACNNDEECLEKLAESIVGHMSLPETTQTSVQKCKSNIMANSGEVVSCDFTNISKAQHQLDGVIGHLDKCVHETIFH